MLFYSCLTILGQFPADGMLYLYNQDFAQFDEGYWATIKYHIDYQERQLTQENWQMVLIQGNAVPSHR